MKNTLRTYNNDFRLLVIKMIFEHGYGGKLEELLDWETAFNRETGVLTFFSEKKREKLNFNIPKEQKSKIVFVK